MTSRDYLIRFNLTADTELRPSDRKEELQIIFNTGRWICLSLKEADETPSQLAERLKHAKKDDRCSFWVEIDDVLYDTTGRCQMIQFNTKHNPENWDFESAVEQWHQPGPTLSKRGA